MAKALIFDSGVGGLSVVAEIRQHLPWLHLTYVADDEFRPYGNKSEAELRARLPSLLRILYETVDPDIIVIACNTASTTALADIRQAVPCPVIGVVPAIKPAAELSRTKTIAVLGTPGTVQRKYVDSLITQFASDCQVILQGSVALVELAEQKLAGQTIDAAALKAEIAPLFTGRMGADIDVVVLACTHFPLLRNDLKAVSRQSIHWIDSGKAIARRAETVLKTIETSDSKDRSPDVALLIGAETGEARKQAFAKFGFEHVVNLN